VTRINTWLADRLSDGLSTMWLFYALVALTWGSVLVRPPQGAQGWDLFLVSIFFQGVALPILNNTTARQSAKTLRLLQETHDTVMAELTSLRQLHASQAEELAALRTLARHEGEPESGDAAPKGDGE
jgi:hypothetical protein